MNDQTEKRNLSMIVTITTRSQEPYGLQLIATACAGESQRRSWMRPSGKGGRSISTSKSTPLLVASLDLHTCSAWSRRRKTARTHQIRLLRYSSQSIDPLPAENTCLWREKTA